MLALISHCTACADKLLRRIDRVYKTQKLYSACGTCERNLRRGRPPDLQCVVRALCGAGIATLVERLFRVTKAVCHRRTGLPRRASQGAPDRYRAHVRFLSLECSAWRATIKL